MKRIAFIAVSSALVLGGSALAAASSGAAGRPWLRLTETDPLTVRGGNFKAGEQITVTASTLSQTKAKHMSKAARSTATGSFTVSLPGFNGPDCAPWSVTARGASGDRAAIKIVPQCGVFP